MVDFSPFMRRRERVLAEIEDGVLICASAAPSVRNNDVTHEFRQDSDFYYLTGFDEPDALLVLSGGASPRSILFLRPKDPARELWDGERLGIEGAAVLGVEARPIYELENELPRLLVGHSSVFARFGGDELVDVRIARAMREARRESRRGVLCPSVLVDAANVLHELRRKKEDGEVQLLERAIAITGEAFALAMNQVRPDMYEYEIEALLRATFRARGSERVAYEPIVGSGDNATVLHYVKNRRQMQDGDLVLVDAGCEYGYYAADITRTFPVSGRFSRAQREVYEVVLAAQQAAVEVAAPGATLEELHQAAVRRISEGLVALGVLQGSARDVEADGRYKPFFMHKTSHYLGMDVHDVGGYFEAGKPRPLEPGVVITVEPGLYFSSAAVDIPERFRGIGVRFEDDLLIEAGGARVLSASIPKDPTDVERACRA